MNIDAAAIEGLDFAKGDGLLPAIVQHADTGAVLMQGWMNADALRATLEGKRVVFFSRSRQRLWQKGETSGHHLELAGMHADCDRDALLVLARPQGPVCHLGTATCFGDAKLTAAERVSFIQQLEGVIEQRITERPESSYTARLWAQGTARMAQKVGEEAIEVSLAAVGAGPNELVGEAADLLFHLMVLLRARGAKLEDVIAELAKRHAARPASIG